MSRSISIPRSCRTRSTAWRRIVRFERPRKSNLSRPSASIAVHLVLGHQPVRVGRLLERHELGQRLAADDDARRRGCEALRATPSSCRAKSVIRLTACGSPSTMLAQLGRRLDRLVELDARAGSGPPWRSGRPRRSSCPSTRPTSRIAARASIVPKVMIWATWSWPYLRADVGDDLLAPAVLEVDVDVGHRHPVRVEEALERQLVEDRVDRRDPEGVGHDRARARCPGRSSGCRCSRANRTKSATIRK